MTRSYRLYFVRTDGGGRSPPVHTFGFDKDHDVAANEAAIQDGFAQCIGGLLSVADELGEKLPAVHRRPESPRLG
uniref:Uncharacterized protein n=2 Tax=Oryza TaxID=4527 RepID=A0A0E0E7L2_9ORYZ